MNAPHTFPTASITPAQANALHDYAKRRGAVQIMLAAAAVMDALNGEGWQQLPEHEDELFELIEGRSDSPCWYGILRECVA